MSDSPLRLVAVCASPRFIQFLLPVWNHIHDRGHETHIICGRGMEPMVPPPALTRHRFHPVDIARSLAPGRDLLCLAQMARVLRSVRPHIVHAHGPKAGLLGMLSASAQRVPGRLYSIHGLRHETLVEPMLSVLKHLERLSARLAHQVLCVSESVRKRAIVDLGLLPDQLGILLHGSAAGVDATRQFLPEAYPRARAELRAQLKIADRAQLVGFVGRFARDKGIAELTEAWRQASATNQKAHLVLVGEQDTTDPVSTDELLALPRVHLLGFRPNPASIYAALDLLLLPSYREGFPQVLLEAAAMKLPAIATRVTGCVDAIVEGKTGLLVPPHDAFSLASATLELLDDPPRRKAMGEAARTRALSDYAVEPLAQATLELYERLLER